MGLFKKKKAKQARPVVVDVGAVQVGAGKATADNTFVSRSYAEVVDLLCEGPIQGITSGKYSYNGVKEATGYRSISFENYSATGLAGDTNELGFLQSVYWNEIPVVDSDGFYNFSAINLQYVKGDPAGNIPTLNPDMTSYANIPANDQMDLSVSRSIGERLYGPEIEGGDLSPDAEFKHATLKRGTKIDKYAKTYTVLNKEVSKLEVNIKVQALMENVQDGPKTFRKAGELKRGGGADVGFGDTKARTIEYSIYYKPLFDQRFSDTSTDTTKVKSSAPQRTWSRAKTERVTGKIEQPYIRRTEIDLSRKSFNDQEGFEGWQIRIVRITPESFTSFLRNVSFVDSIVEVFGTKLRYPYTAMMYSQFDARSFSRIPARAYDAHLIKVKVPDNYNPLLKTYGDSNVAPSTDADDYEDGIQKGDRTNSDYTTSTQKWQKGTVGADTHWDGNFAVDKNGNTVKLWTDNPAWCFYDLMTNPRYGLGEFIEESQIDKWALYEIAQYCDVLVPDTYGALEPRFTINYIITSREEAFKVLNDLAAIFRGIAYYSNGNIFAVQDKLKNAIYQFTNSNVVNGNFSYSSSAQKARHTVAIVRYNDKKNLFQPALEYLEDEEGVRRYGIREIETTALGCTSRGQARRFAKWILASEFEETETVSFSAGQEGAYLMPGDVVQIYDNFRSPLKYSGRTNAVTPLTPTHPAPSTVIGSSAYNSIILDQALNFTASKNYKFSLLTPSYNTTTGDATDIRRTQLQNLVFNGSDVSLISGNYRSDLMESGSGVCTQIYFDTGSPYGTENQLDFTNYVITGYTNPGVWTAGGTGDPTYISESYSGGCYSGENLIWSVEPQDPDDTEFISGSYSNFRIINVKEDEGGAYSVSALAYSTGKYDKIFNSAALVTAEVVNPPLFPTGIVGETDALTNLTFVPDEYNPVFNVQPGTPDPANIFTSVEINFPQAGFEIEPSELKVYEVKNPRHDVSTEEQESPKEIYDIDYTIGVTTTNLGSTTDVAQKYGLPSSSIDLNKVYIISPSKFKEYKPFTTEIINSQDSDRLGKEGVNTEGQSTDKTDRVFSEYLVTDVATDTEYFWVSLFATSITNDVSYGMVTKIKVENLQEVSQSIVGAIDISNLTTEGITPGDIKTIHSIDAVEPGFSWEAVPNDIFSTPEGLASPRYELPIPQNLLEYRVTVREPSVESTPNGPNKMIYVEATGYTSNSPLSPSFVVQSIINDPNKIREYRDDPYVTGWTEGAVDTNKETALWLSLSGSGLNILNNENIFPLRTFDVVVEAQDGEGNTSAGNKVFQNTLLAAPGNDTENQENFPAANPLSYDIIGVTIEPPSGVIFAQTNTANYKSTLTPYDFITPSQAYALGFPYAARAAIYPNGWFELQVSPAEAYNGEVKYTDEDLDPFFNNVAGVVLYYTTGNNIEKAQENNNTTTSVPTNLAPSFTVDINTNNINHIKNTGIVSPVDGDGNAFGEIIQTTKGYDGNVFRRYRLLGEDEDLSSLRIPLPTIVGDTVSNIEMSFAFFDTLSLRSYFDLSDGVTPKTYENEPDNDDNELKSDLIYKDYSINFSRQVDMVTYDSLVGKKGIIGQGNAPQSISLNESSIRSGYDTALAFRGWASLVLSPNPEYVIGEGLLPRSPDGKVGADIEHMLNPVSEISQGVKFTAWCSYKLHVGEPWGPDSRTGCHYTYDIHIQVERPQAELGKTVVMAFNYDGYLSHKVYDNGQIVIYKGKKRTIQVPPNSYPGNERAGVKRGDCYPPNSRKENSQFPGSGYKGGFEKCVNKPVSEGGWGDDATDTWTAKMRGVGVAERFNFAILTSD